MSDDDATAQFSEIETGSPTQFAWSVLGMRGYPPPEVKRGLRYGASAQCWLCGGATDGKGRPRDKALPVTFASHNEAAAQSSDAVCEACAAFSGGDTWQAYVQERAPELKNWAQASWRSYGHMFAAPSHHECPSTARWRQLFFDPPEPPFLAIVSLTGQKNLIFRGRIAHSRDVFPVQVEEGRMLLDRAQFADCVGDVEHALAAGLSREGMRTGRYHPEAWKRVGLRRFEAIVKTITRWRETKLALLELTLRCAALPERQGR